MLICLPEVQFVEVEWQARLQNFAIDRRERERERENCESTLITDSEEKATERMKWKEEQSETGHKIGILSHFTLDRPLCSVNWNNCSSHAKICPYCLHLARPLFTMQLCPVSSRVLTHNALWVYQQRQRQEMRSAGHREGETNYYLPLCLSFLLSPSFSN